jgi:nucleotide-binding universal stress UspA family protein
MFKNIFIPVDDSEATTTAVREGVALAKSIGAKVTGFHAMPRFHGSILQEGAFKSLNPIEREEFAKEEKARAEKCLSLVRHFADDEGVSCECFYESSDYPYEAIIKAAQEKGCDLIMMTPHHGLGIAGLIGGSETAKVLARSTIPVLICH